MKPHGNKGRVLTPEHKAKIALSRKGQRLSPQTKNKISAANTGRRHTPEQIEKIRAEAKARPTDYEKINAMAAANRGRKHSPELVNRRVESYRKTLAAKQGKPVEPLGDQQTNPTSRCNGMAKPKPGAGTRPAS